MTFVALRWDVERQLQDSPAFRRRGFRRIIKAALFKTLLEWHRQFARYHFMREAYARYGSLGVYQKQKKRGDPLVQTGTLRKRILARKSEADIRGTARQARLVMRYGMPPKYSAEELRKQVLITMSDRHVSYRRAQRIVYSAAGYSKEARQRFAAWIPALSGGEARHLRTFMRDEIVRRMNAGG